jgi:transglutaminase-like putative cysteine protease
VGSEGFFTTIFSNRLSITHGGGPMLLSNPEPGNTEVTCPSDAPPTDHLLDETVYCDHSHPAITELAAKIALDSSKQIDIIENIFLFVRDRIVFGGDHWQVKASETLLKGYGACYNKNILMIALLRAANMHSKLMANPVHKSFTQPSVGGIHVLFSDPFYHCFTHVLIDGRWVALDPTLDRTT